MNDGGEESKRREAQYNRSNYRAGPDNYGRAISKVAVAQVCESVGFESLKDSALEALSDIAVRYIRDLGKSAVYYANVSGRSEPNVFDIIEGLEDLALTKGFLGASGLDYCATSSGALKELIDYGGTVEEIPFAQPILQFPLTKSCNRWNSYLQRDAEPSGSHIPSWLPPFPEPQAYLKYPMQNQRQTDSPVGVPDQEKQQGNPEKSDKANQEKQQGNPEKSVIADQEKQQGYPEKSDARLQQRLLSGSAAGPSGSANRSEASEEVERVKVNPFLAPPLPAGEREVSEVTVPSKLLNCIGARNYDPLSETSAPAINITKGREDGSMDMKRSVDSERRPVRFRLKTSKKTLLDEGDLDGNKGGEGWVPTVEINEERDEKKRKAALIFRQSMEHAQELT